MASFVTPRGVVIHMESAPAATSVGYRPAEVVAGGLVEPPRSGKGSGREAWARYARSVGVEVADGMTRDDIADAVTATKEA